MGGTDAGVIAFAERLKDEVIAPRDRRHSRVVMPLHCGDFRLPPEGTGEWSSW